LTVKWIIVGVITVLLAIVFWIWAIQDGSFSVAAGADTTEGAEWLRRANLYVWIGYGLLASAVAAFFTAWRTGRRKSPPRE
jgi:hypothetical protein